MRKLRFVEILAWITGSALLAIWGGYKLNSSLGSRADIRRFEQAKVDLEKSTVLESQTVEAAVREPEPSHQADLVVPTAVDYSLWAEGRIREYEESLAEELGAPEAIFRIPKLDLEVAVLEGTSDFALNRGVGRIVGTAGIGEGGNLGIAGHRDGFFRGLKDLETGDRMEVETLSGVHTYVIDKISIVSPEDVYVLAPSEEPRVTLVTCYPFYFVGKAPLRYIVHGIEISQNEASTKVALETSP